jgi:putative endonuclease
MTKDIEKRIKQHNSVSQRSTKRYRPLKLIFVEDVNGNRNQARAREKYWKSGIGREKLRILKDKS